MLPTPTTADTYYTDTEEIEFKSKRMAVRLVISEPTVLTDSRRYAYSETVREQVVAHSDWDATTQGIIFYSYPQLVACVVEAEGFKVWPPTVEEFAAFPRPLWDAWTAAAKRRCPEWFPEDEQVRKEAAPDPKEPAASSSD